MYRLPIERRPPVRARRQIAWLGMADYTKSGKRQLVSDDPGDVSTVCVVGVLGTAMTAPVGQDAQNVST
jgi:hypothetical protein